MNYTVTGMNSTLGSAPPRPGPPVNIELPVIPGTALPGDTLACSTGVWTNDPTGFTYQWNRAGNPIPGATGNRYTVQIADSAQALTCTVTASNSAGDSAPATGATVLVAVKGTLHCPKPSGRLAGISLGRLSLGMTRTQARDDLKRSTVIGYGFDDFCLYAGFGIRAAYGTAKLVRSLPAADARLRGRLVIALTANPYYTLHGVKPGAKLASVKRKLQLVGPFHVGLNYWYLGPNGTSRAIVGVRGGIIQEIGIANKQLTTRTTADLRFIDSFS